MWRMLNNVSRAFRNHIYNPRPSAGVLAEDDPDSQEKCEHSDDSACTVNCGEERHQHCGRVVNRVYNADTGKAHQGRFRGHCGENEGGEWGADGEESGRERHKTYHTEFWRLLHGTRSFFEAVTWGPAIVWGTETDNYRRRTRLLYRVLFALHSGQDVTSPSAFGKGELQSSSTLEPACEPQPLTQPLAIKDAAGSAADNEINSLKTETLESAMQEFELACQAYTAGSESVLGLQALDRGDAASAVKHLKRSCRLGNASACFNLALCYETGTGVPQDKAKAIRYYQKAASQGHSKALYNVGLLCLQGKEEGDVHTEALTRDMGLDFLTQAARLGLPEAQTYLGVHNMQEHHEPVKAVSYFKAAADQNDHEAQYLLGVCYETGVGVETNECMAARLYSQAAQGGHDIALYNLAVFNEQGLGGLPQNKETAMEMYQKAAELGNGQAEERLTEMTTALDTGQSHDDLADANPTETDGTSYPTTILSPFEQEAATLQETESSPAFDIGHLVLPAFSALNLQASLSSPSLRLASSLEHSIYMFSQQQHPDSKLVVRGERDSSRTSSCNVSKVQKCVLRKVNHFLGLRPNVKSLRHHRPNFYDFESPMGFSPWSVAAATDYTGESVSEASMTRPRTSSEFSMIGI